MQRPDDLLTPWGVPYFGPVQQTDDLLWFAENGKRYPLRRRMVICGELGGDDAERI